MCARHQHRRAGFTLVEVLMVVLIMLIASAVALPSLMRSFRGARLRASTRHIVMASRYARSMAVLQQVQTALMFDATLNSLEIVSIAMPRRDTSIFLNDPLAPVGEEDEATPLVESRLHRYLEQGVSIVDVRGDGQRGVPETDGIYTVRFFPNGMCDPYEVMLEDDLGQRMRIAVNPLSGRVSTEALR